MRKVQCQVINDIDLDTSPVYYSNQTDIEVLVSTKSDNEQTNVNNETKPTPAPNQTIGNLAEIDNSARAFEWNAPVITKLFENLVIQTTGNASISSKKIPLQLMKYNYQDYCHYQNLIRKIIMHQLMMNWWYHKLPNVIWRIKTSPQILFGIFSHIHSIWRNIFPVGRLEKHVQVLWTSKINAFGTYIIV